MNKLIFVLTSLFILAISISIISASDILVWQGQYYTGTTFNIGTYEFNFSVYDALTGGDICYSNITNLTTGSFGEWKTEQSGVSAACNNVSKDYYLNINIDGIDQSPRKRLIIWNYLRKDVNETTSGTFQADVQVVAPIVQANTKITAPTVNATTIIADEMNISTNANIIGTLRGHSPLKIGDSIQFVNTNDTNLFSLYTAGEGITGSNVSSEYYGVIIHQIESHTNPYDIEECWWDREDQEMRMCMDKNNIEMWNNLLVNKNLTVTSNISANKGFFSYLGSLTSRIVELFVRDIDFNGTITGTGNITTTGNITANNFIGNGSLLTGLLVPVYLTSNLTSTNAENTTIFNITLTPGKMNVIQAYLAQSSSAANAAIQNKGIISSSGPIGYCHFTTQINREMETIDNIAVSITPANTAENSMEFNINMPFLNTVTCIVLADANQNYLIIQFKSETAAAVTTYAGSYYTKVVN